MDRRRRPRLSLDLLRGFRAAARHLSFTRAAHELSVTQSAISREIRTLEDQIGQPLFQRVHRGLQLTRAGEELFRAADEAISHLDAVTERLSGSARTLAVQTTTGLASLWLAPRLPQFNKLHPAIDVRVVASNDKPDLERDQLDIAIRFVPQGADVPEGEPLFDCRSLPVCAPASTLYFPQYDQEIAAAVEGSGVAMGVLPHVLPHLRQGQLRAPFGGDAIAHWGVFYLIRRRDLAERPAIESFVAWLKSEARREAEQALPALRERPRGRRK